MFLSASLATSTIPIPEILHDCSSLALLQSDGMFNPWQSETLTRKHWSTSRKQTTLRRSKAKSFSHPKSLSASYRKPKSGLDRQGRLRRRRSLSHASHFASSRSRRPEKLDSRFLARSEGGHCVRSFALWLSARALSFTASRPLVSKASSEPRDHFVDLLTVPPPIHVRLTQAQ